MRVPVLAALAVLAAGVPAFGQGVLLDRVVARVGDAAITLSDVRAAVGIGLVAVPEGADPTTAGTEALVDRQLVLTEVARFPPAEPAVEVVDAELAALRARAGTGLPALMEETGFDEARLRQAARDSARIAAYLASRFGTNLPVSEEEVARYYRLHPDEFTEGGRLLTFAEAEAAARIRASAERRQQIIDEWIAGLRARSEITVLTP